LGFGYHSTAAHSRRTGESSLMLKRIALLVIFVAFSFANTRAQDRFDFYGRGPYRASVPRPSSVTGYEPGEFQTSHGQVARVIEKLAAAATDRVRVIENGETWEHRKLYLVVVSAPENLARLDEIKANLAKLSDPRQIKSEDEASQLARNM